MYNKYPKISVIMGVYNCENTLEESINSIIEQTYENWELIICDDCSTDSTLDIASKYAKEFPNKIKLIKNQENMTLAPTLNKCLEIAKGEYIARQDGDDISIKDRLQKQIDFLLNNEEFDLVGSQMISFDKNGAKGVRGPSKKIPEKSDLIVGTPFCHATILAKKDVYKKLQGYRVNKFTTRCEDLDLWFRFFEMEFKGYNLDEALYRVRDDNNAYKRRDFKNYLNVFITSFSGFKRVKMPIKYYIYLVKPLITILIPTFVIKEYHKRKIANTQT